MAVLSDAEWRQALEATAVKIRSCTGCRLHAARTNAVPGEGPSPASLFLLGEAPGRDEDASGRPFVGRAGRILDAALAAAHVRRDAVYITNVAKCRPPHNRRPTRDEVAACRGFLMGQVACVRPRVIVTLGATALRGLLGPGPELEAVRGRTLVFGGLPVLPTYHPAAVLYNRRLEPLLRRDLAAAVRIADRTTNRPATGRTPSRGRRARRSRRPPR